MTPRRFDLEIVPVRDAGRWAAFDIRYRVDLEPVAEGETLLSLPEVLVSMPASCIEALSVSDDLGLLAISEVATSTDSSGTYRHWVVERASSGTIEVVCRAPVREVDERTPVGPLLDLRPEPHGLFGAGVMFLPLPTTDAVFDISLSWALPEGVTAVSSRGVGEQAWHGSLQTVAFCYYAAGTPWVEPADSPGFAIHAFSDVPFGLSATARYIRDLHHHMCRFFEDDGSSFHVLVRQFLGSGRGGSAMPGSFAFGYSAIEPVDENELRSLLAHEMAHNWPRLDAGHDEGSWYTEGTAEYYSHVLPLRGEMLSVEQFATQLTERIQAYDINPLRTLTNEQAGAAFWVDPRAQRIPYGRGLRYLIATDGHIRDATHDERSLDDVVVDILRAQRAGAQVGIEGWIDRVAALTGDVARDRYAQMVAGERIDLPDVLFEGRVFATAAVLPEHALGFDVSAYRDQPRLVKGVVSGSRAEAAGLRDGDELVDRSLPYQSARRSDTSIDVHVIRGGQGITITYEPRGADVPTVAWTVPARDDREPTQPDERLVEPSVEDRESV